MTTENKNPYANLRYEDFRRLAKDQALTQYERIGFPNKYREGYEEIIYTDILSKLTNLGVNNQNILDIGPGCSALPRQLMQTCQVNDHSLWMIDSPEMLAQIADAPYVTKIPGLYPNDCMDYIISMQGGLNAILCYSVLHYVVLDVSLLTFLDACLSLLAPGGQLLLGDIPNISKRKRFFASKAGIDFHQRFMNTKDHPEVHFNQVEYDQIDDSLIFFILQRSRLSGFDAYVLPQTVSLPMSNRREDILIIRP